MTPTTRPAGRSRGLRVTALALVTAGATLAGIGFASGTGHAEMYSQWHVAFPYENSFEECGFNIDLSGNWEAHGNQRVGTGSQVGLFPGNDNYEYTETWTNVDNGKYFTIHANGTAVQTAARNLGGTLWEGTYKVAENWQVIDASGNLVLRDAGLTTRTQVFDDNGDNSPGITLISETVRSVGHQQLANMTQAEICSGMANLIG